MQSGAVRFGGEAVLTDGDLLVAVEDSYIIIERPKAIAELAAAATVAALLANKIKTRAG